MLTEEPASTVCRSSSASVRATTAERPAPDVRQPLLQTQSEWPIHDFSVAGREGRGQVESNPTFLSSFLIFFPWNCGS